MSSIFLKNEADLHVAADRLSDGDLVARALTGSERAFTELWNRHRERTRRVISQITRNQEDAEDILQETSMKLFLHLDGFKGEAQFATWLTRIAINSAFMFLRRRRGRREHLIDSAQSDLSALIMNIPGRTESAEARLSHSQHLKELRLAVRRLPHSLRHIVELRNRDELSLDEIAQRTGISLSAVKTRLMRARTTLRRLTTKCRRRASLHQFNNRSKEISLPISAAS